MAELIFIIPIHYCPIFLGNFLCDFFLPLTRYTYDLGVKWGVNDIQDITSSPYFRVFKLKGGFLKNSDIRVMLFSSKKHQDMKHGPKNVVEKKSFRTFTLLLCIDQYLQYCPFPISEKWRHKWHGTQSMFSRNDVLVCCALKYYASREVFWGVRCHL